MGIRRLLERLNAAVLLAATTRERRLRGDSNSLEIKDVSLEPNEPIITPAGEYLLVIGVIVCLIFLASKESNSG